MFHFVHNSANIYLFIYVIFCSGTCVSFNCPICQNSLFHLLTSEVFDAFSEGETPKLLSLSLMKTLKYLNTIAADQVSILQRECLWTERVCQSTVRCWSPTVAKTISNCHYTSTCRESQISRIYCKSPFFHFSSTFQLTVQCSTCVFVVSRFKF